MMENVGQRGAGIGAAPKEELVKVIGGEWITQEIGEEMEADMEIDPAGDTWTEIETEADIEIETETEMEMMKKMKMKMKKEEEADEKEKSIRGNIRGIKRGNTRGTKGENTRGIKRENPNT